jgi:hypothetical protein
MENSEAIEFAQVLEAALGMYGKTATKSSIGIWFEALREFGLDEVRRAFGAHMKDTERGHFAPMPSDIIRHIPTGHPDPQEAWSMVAAGIADERVTLVMTDEIRAAFFAAVDLADDKIAARMTFLERYKREIANARTEGTKPKWTVSLGFDKEGQEQPITEAIRLGRIQVTHACVLLPHKADRLALAAPATSTAMVAL